MGQSAGAHIAACTLLEQAVKESNGPEELLRVLLAKQVINKVIQGHDCLVVMATGAGKSLRVYDTQKDTLAFTAVDKFLPDQVYYHGCLKSFLQITKWRGPEVIYFGDKLFSDLRGPSKAGWRTAAVIRELEDEIEIQNGDSYRSSSGVVPIAYVVRSPKSSLSEVDVQKFMEKQVRLARSPRLIVTSN